MGFTIDKALEVLICDFTRFLAIHYDGVEVRHERH